MYIFRLIKNYILRTIYKLLIFKVIILKKEINMAKRANVFCELEINTNLGPIKFVFKEKRERNIKENIFRTFFIEAILDDNMPLKRKEMKENIVMIIKIALIKVNYEVLSKLLLDLYIQTILNKIKEDSK